MGILEAQLETILPTVCDFDSFLHGLLANTLGWEIGQGVRRIEDISYLWTEADLGAEGLTARDVKVQVWQIQPLPVGRATRGIFLVQFDYPDPFTKGRGMVGPLRQVLRGLVPRLRRHDPQLPCWRCEDLLFICTYQYEHFTFAHFRGQSHASAALTTFGWVRDQVGWRTLCEFNLPKLRWPEAPADHTAWRKEWASAFDKNKLVERFFDEFTKACKVLAADIAAQNAWDESKANTEAQALLERLLFLYFVQRKGWLNRSRSYLLDEFNRDHADSPDATSYTEDFLHLVFRRLARPRMRGDEERGYLPFLNGGLFPDEPQPVRVTNRTMEGVFKNLLERYNFTIREDTPLDQDVAIDPEMLGKVLECLILTQEKGEGAPDQRKATGSYYTPRIVVHFICREVLRQFLLARLHVRSAGFSPSPERMEVPSNLRPEGRTTNEEWPARLNGLFAVDASAGVTAEKLEKLRSLIPPDDARRIRHLLHALKACDPAVGSGAFAVGLLHELVNITILCQTIECGKDPRIADLNRVYELKEHFIENAIYGVDFREDAAEICKLRLWLSLIVDFQLSVDPFTCAAERFGQAIQEVRALPNLDFKVRRGDSLLDQIHGHPIQLKEYRERAAAAKLRDLLDELAAIKHDFFGARDGLRKRSLLRKAIRAKLDLAELFITEELKPRAAIQDDLIDADHPDLRERRLGEAEKRRLRQAEKARLEEALADVRATRDNLDRLKPSCGSLSAEDENALRILDGQAGKRISFVWAIDFMEVFRRTVPHTGFDIIVGNPPFVTARNPIRREQYRNRWPMVCYQKFSLVAPFFQCSFGLLAPGGHLGFIVSNAFAKREFGKPLVEDFFPSVDITKIVDCSGLMFPGHGTPTCIVFGRANRPQPNGHIRVAAILPGGGDLLTPPEESRTWHTLAQHHEDQGFSDGKVVVTDWETKEVLRWPMNLDAHSEETRGLMELGQPIVSSIVDSAGPSTLTRSDEVFIQPPDLLRRLQIEVAHVRRIVPGDDIRDWSLVDAQSTIFPYGDAYSRIHRRAAPAMFAFLSHFRQHLESVVIFDKPKSDTDIPWWEYTDPYPAKNVSPECLAFPEIATHCHFTFANVRDLFPQTAPVLKLPKGATELDHHILAGFLNSSAALFWLKQVCFNKNVGAEEERDRYVYAGGKVEQLPVPGAIASALSYREGQLAGGSGGEEGEKP